jgi:hypothetical protein
MVPMKMFTQNDPLTDAEFDRMVKYDFGELDEVAPAYAVTNPQVAGVGVSGCRDPAPPCGTTCCCNGTSSTRASRGASGCSC